MNPYLQNILHNITERLTKLERKEWAGLDNDDEIYIYNHADKSVGRAIELTEKRLKEKNHDNRN